MCTRFTQLLVAAAGLGCTAPAVAQRHPPPGRIRLTSSPSAAVRVVAPPTARLAVVGGAPGVRRGDTLLVRTPVELAAALIPGEVRIEVIGATAVTLDADAAPAPSTRRVGGVGRVFVLKTGTRGIELPGTSDGIRELGGSAAPARHTAFAPDAALSRAFPSGPGV